MLYLHTSARAQLSLLERQHKLKAQDGDQRLIIVNLFGFYRILGIYRVAEQQLAFQ
jgi:hypothetical protein